MIKTSFICVYFCITFLPSNSQKFKSAIAPTKRSLIYNQKIKFFENHRQTLCVSYMNKYYGPKNQWDCHLLDNQHTANKTYLIFKKKALSECLCSYKYECYDYEDFQLENDVVDLNEYMKKENFIGKNFYTENCENGLKQLTDYDNWNCALKYDRFHIDEYYCSCKRIKTCQIEKLLKL